LFQMKLQLALRHLLGRRGRTGMFRRRQRGTRRFGSPLGGG
jgi:hypothetical protein